MIGDLIKIPGLHPWHNCRGFLDLHLGLRVWRKIEDTHAVPRLRQFKQAIRQRL